MVYAAYYIHKDGRKTRIECESADEYKPGDVIDQWNGDKIIIDFKWSENVYKLYK